MQANKDVIIKESSSFRLRMVRRCCLSPKDLNSLELIQEQLIDGVVTDSSTYNFFLTDDEILTLSKELSE
jgi:hypothetical protein